jgi:hypothetical protein
MANRQSDQPGIGPATRVVDSPARLAALKRLEPFLGAWSMEATFPQDPSNVLGGGRCVFEWMRSEQFLVQRTEAPDPALASMAIIGLHPDDDAYTQHYFDSRGVARLYAMTFKDGVWELRRDSPDFSPLDFKQRFVGTFSDDRQMIRGVWEKCTDGTTWQLDVHLTYRRVR